MNDMALAQHTSNSALRHGRARHYGMVWYGMVDDCDGYLAAEASGSSYVVWYGMVW